MPNFKHIATKDIPGEKEIFRTRPSGWILFGRLLPLVVAMIGLVVIFELSDTGQFFGGAKFWLWSLILLIGIFLGAIIFAGWYSTIYRVTNRRIEYRFGIFGFKESEMAIEDIQSVEARQSFIGILLGYGDITVRTAAKVDKEITLAAVSKPGPRTRQIEDLAAL